jgi:hypothetical protein
MIASRFFRGRRQLLITSPWAMPNLLGEYPHPVTGQ